MNFERKMGLRPLAGEADQFVGGGVETLDVRIKRAPRKAVSRGGALDCGVALCLALFGVNTGGMRRFLANRLRVSCVFAGESGELRCGSRQGSAASEPKAGALPGCATPRTNGHCT